MGIVECGILLGIAVCKWILLGIVEFGILLGIAVCKWILFGFSECCFCVHVVDVFGYSDSEFFVSIRFELYFNFENFSKFI